MAVTLVADAGSASANSYATVAEADAYHANHLYGAEWAGAADLKMQALITATRLLEENAVWIGSPATSGQALGWPRNGGVTRTGYAIANTIIPDMLKNATSELARLLIVAGGMPNSGGTIPAGLKGLKAGPVALEFDPMKTNEAEDMLPITVWSMISMLLDSQQPGRTNVALVRA